MMHASYYFCLSSERKLNEKWMSQYHRLTFVISRIINSSLRKTVPIIFYHDMFTLNNVLFADSILYGIDVDIQFIELSNRTCSVVDVVKSIGFEKYSNRFQNRRSKFPAEVYLLKNRNLSHNELWILHILETYERLLVESTDRKYAQLKWIREDSKAHKHVLQDHFRKKGQLFSEDSTPKKSFESIVYRNNSWYLSVDKKGFW